MRILTLLTDFGSQDAYVAAMKGVILSLVPHATLVDITHEVSPQDVLGGAFLLATCWRTFPKGTVHLAVVDPGVGSKRRGIVLFAEGHYFVGPDNGLFSLALADVEKQIVAVENQRLFRHPVSPTFHGRDIFAPVAAHLLRGEPMHEIGPQVADMVLLPQAEPRAMGASEWEATVVWVDRFGNLVTNLPERLLRDREIEVAIAGEKIQGLSSYYGQVPPGSLVALIGSSGFLEVAENLGSAAKRLGAGRGTRLRVRVSR